jgi:hypothetical protein
LVGIVLFFALLFPLTDPSIYDSWYMTLLSRPIHSQ